MFVHLFLSLSPSRELWRKLDILSSDGGQKFVSLHGGGAGGVAHLKQNDTQAVHVHLLPGVCACVHVHTHLRCVCVFECVSVSVSVSVRV